MEAGGKRYIQHPSRSDVFTIYNLADLHLGSAATAEAHLARDIEAIRADPHAFWFGGGDYAEYISYKDRRHNLQAFAPWLTVDDLSNLGRVLARRVRDTLKPIAHKCLGLLFGNHEDTYERTQEQTDLHGWLCQELCVPNLRYSAFVDVVFERNPRKRLPASSMTPASRKDLSKYGGSSAFRFLLHHGAGAATTPGGKLNKLIQFMQMFDADIYMIGHVHDQKGQRLVTVGANDKCDGIVSRDKVGVITGSYLRTYAKGVTTYGEKKGYAPVPLGASFVRIRPETREVKAEV